MIFPDCYFYFAHLQFQRITVSYKICNNMYHSLPVKCHILCFFPQQTLKKLKAGLGLVWLLEFKCILTDLDALNSIDIEHLLSMFLIKILYLSD